MASNQNEFLNDDTVEVAVLISNLFYDRRNDEQCIKNLQPFLKDTWRTVTRQEYELLTRYIHHSISNAIVIRKLPEPKGSVDMATILRKCKLAETNELKRIREQEEKNRIAAQKRADTLAKKRANAEETERKKVLELAQKHGLIPKTPGLGQF
jgi:TorA maturation chaperone TorD